MTTKKNQFKKAKANEGCTSHLLSQLLLPQLTDFFLLLKKYTDERHPQNEILKFLNNLFKLKKSIQFGKKKLITNPFYFLSS